MNDLNDFKLWANEDTNRTVKIEIENGEVEIWVYDRCMMCGQFATSVAEIDLEGLKKSREKAKYEELKAKYEAI